jgi:hypothetical protein
MLVSLATRWTLLVLFVSTSLAVTLPSYSGPFDVGIVDIEVPVSQPRTITNVTLVSNGQPAFQVRRSRIERGMLEMVL